jgi:hypothetical protein
MENFRAQPSAASSFVVVQFNFETSTVLMIVDDQKSDVRDQKSEPPVDLTSDF